MAKCWLVTGTTGEWSDRGEWPVKVFLSKSKAESFVTKLKEVYLSFPQESQGYMRGDNEMKELEENMQVLDPEFTEDYTGTSYWISEVELDNG